MLLLDIGRERPHVAEQVRLLVKLLKQYLLNLLLHLMSLLLLRPHSLVFVQGHVAAPTVQRGLRSLGKAGSLYTGRRRAPEMAMLPLVTEAAQRLFSL